MGRRMESYPKAAVERAIKMQEVNFAGHGEEDFVVAGSGDSGHRRSRQADYVATIKDVLRLYRSTR